MCFELVETTYYGNVNSLTDSDQFNLNYIMFMGFKEEIKIVTWKEVLRRGTDKSCTFKYDNALIFFTRLSVSRLQDEEL